MARREVSTRRFPHCAFFESRDRKAPSMRIARVAATLLLGMMAVAGALMPAATAAALA